MSVNRPIISGFTIARSALLLLLLSATFASLAAQSVALLQGRQFAAVAHNTEDNQFLLFGGTDGHKRFEDTWIFGSSGWKPQRPSASPQQRISSALAYDSVRDEFVLFGGRVRNTKSTACYSGALPKGLAAELFCKDTWIFKNNRWTLKMTATLPPRRELHAMAFDVASRQIVMFGGIGSPTTAPLGDTWVWDGGNWKQVITAHKPPARFWHSMAYDPIRQQVVLFGGNNGSRALNDTWLWNGRDWLPAPAQATPPDFYTGAGLEYSATLHKLVLFSGMTWNGQRSGTPSFNSWTWDGRQWKKLPLTDFQLITDFSKLTPAQASKGLFASGTPIMLWVAR